MEIAIWTSMGLKEKQQCHGEQPPIEWKARHPSAVVPGLLSPSPSHPRVQRRLPSSLTARCADLVDDAVAARVAGDVLHALDGRRLAAVCNGDVGGATMRHDAGQVGLEVWMCARA